ncbi:MAG: hypothetical protein ACKOYM_07590 [Actinomycetes bacterium]
MLLVRELLRVTWQTVAFSVATRRAIVLIVLLLTTVAVVMSITVVKAGPVVFYPFL